MRILRYKTKDNKIYTFSELEDFKKSIRNLKIRQELQNEIQTLIKKLDNEFRKTLLKIVNRHKTKLKDINVVNAIKESDIKRFSKVFGDLALYCYLKGFEIANRDLINLKISKLKFSEELEFLRNKISLTREQVEQLSEFFRERYFWLSYLTAIDHIEKVKEILIKTIEEGGTYKDFYKKLTDEKLAIDEIRGVFVKRPFYAETVYRTNIINAFNSGRLRRLKEAGVEYFEFHTAIDERTCPICKKLNGTIRRADDPFWRHFKPPLHYNCRCTIIPSLHHSKEEPFIDEEDYEKFFLEKFSDVENKNLVEITRKFTKNRLYDFEFDFFPDREKVEELFKELQKKKGISLINVENKIIDKMPFELKDIALKQKYQFKNRPNFKPNEEEQKTIKNYTLTNYVSINDALRSNEITGKVRKDIEILQGVFLKYKQNGDLNKVLYRGVSVDKETFQKLLSLKEGEILKNFDNAFASTSYDEKVASNFVIKKGQYGVIFKIVKRKTPGIELEKFSLFPHEKEVLLPYSFWNRLKILSKNIKNNIIEIEVEEI